MGVKMLLSSSIRQKIYKSIFLTFICRKIVGICNIFFYKSLCLKTHCNKKLMQYKNQKNGKRCFIIGNGPSLQATDLDKLINEDCFACNHIEKMFQNTVWRPTYYMVSDAYFAQDIDITQFQNIFLSAYFRRNHKKYIRKSYYINVINKCKKGYPVFSDDISKYISAGNTVTFCNIQLAVYMGYSELYLLGVDNNFNLTIDSKGKIESHEGKNHFYSDKYMDSKMEKNPSNVELMNKAYISAKRYCDLHNVKIYNATRGGKLELFERVDFDALFLDCKGKSENDKNKNAHI